MKGNNELIINEATMCVAIQEYIEKRITIDTPKVVSVTCSDRLTNLFSVKLEGNNEN